MQGVQDGIGRNEHRQIQRVDGRVSVRESRKLSLRGNDEAVLAQGTQFARGELQRPALHQGKVGRRERVVAERCGEGQGVRRGQAGSIHGFRGRQTCLELKELGLASIGRGRHDRLSRIDGLVLGRARSSARAGRGQPGERAGEGENAICDRGPRRGSHAPNARKRRAARALRNYAGLFASSLGIRGSPVGFLKRMIAMSGSSQGLPTNVVTLCAARE